MDNQQQKKIVKKRGVSILECWQQSKATAMIEIAKELLDNIQEAIR